MVLALAVDPEGRCAPHARLAAATALLGCVFLGGQFYEFTKFYRRA